MSPAPVAASRPISAPPPQGARAANPKKTKKRKRTRGFARFLQVLISALFMIAVPLVALVVAYGYGNGLSLEQDALDLIDDIRELLGM